MAQKKEVAQTSTEKPKRKPYQIPAPGSPHSPAPGAVKIGPASAPASPGQVQRLPVRVHV